MSQPLTTSSSTGMQADLLLMACSRCLDVNFTLFNSVLLAQQCLRAFRDYLNGEKKSEVHMPAGFCFHILAAVSF